MTEQQSTPPFAQWCILELMGHRRLAGFISEQTIAGAAFLRIDIPATEGAPAATQWYSAGAVYAMTPCSEATAREVAGIGRVQPVTEWELPRRITAPQRSEDDDVDYEPGERILADSVPF